MQHVELFDIQDTGRMAAAFSVRVPVFVDEQRVPAEEEIDEQVPPAVIEKPVPQSTQYTAPRAAQPQAHVPPSAMTSRACRRWGAAASAPSSSRLDR